MAHSLIRAHNDTTTYHYYWCPKCQIVLKDVPPFGNIRGVLVK